MYMYVCTMYVCIHVYESYPTGNAYRCMNLWSIYYYIIFVCLCICVCIYACHAGFSSLRACMSLYCLGHFPLTFHPGHSHTPILMKRTLLKYRSWSDERIVIKQK